MRSQLYYSLIVFLFEVIIEGKSSAYQDGDIVAYMDMHRIELCPNCSKNCDKNYKVEFQIYSRWENGLYTRYFSGKIDVGETFEMKKTQQVIYKCHNKGHNCELFMSYYPDMKKICEYANITNSWWTPAVDATQPQTWKKTCPVFHERILYFKDAYIDAHLSYAIFPEATKYHWKLLYFIENFLNNKLLCIIVETGLKRFTYRRRNIKRQ